MSHRNDDWEFIFWGAVLIAICYAAFEFLAYDIEFQDKYELQYLELKK